jgi:geranyl-CoA carboxylase beta subunit
MKFTTKIDSSSDAFAENAEAMRARIDEIQSIRQRQVDYAEKARERFTKRGEVMARDRLAMLLDGDRPFIELCGLAGVGLFGDTDGSTAGGGLIAGIGFVSGVRCLVVVDNFVVKGATITESGLIKKLRCQAIAAENKLPVVTLAQSGGADLRYATDTFVQGARLFANRARLSAQGLPQVTVVHGSATAGGAYDPGLSDYVVFVRNKATMYLAGPPLLKAATGEIASEEELGGAEMHASIAGTGEYLAENDAHAIGVARQIVASLGWDRRDRVDHPAGYDAPLHPREEMLGVVPADTRIPYDAREIIIRFADGSRFLDFKDDYGADTVCGHASVEGYPLGIIANNSSITAEGAAKASQFIQLCDQSAIPLLFLQNTTGFLVGVEQEHAGVIKHGSKMIQAVANARVPRLTLLVGGSYGAGNYAMCGRGLDPRFIFAWPSAKLGVMGGKQAGMVLRIVAEARAARAGGKLDPEVAERAEKEAAAAEQLLEERSGALYCTAKVWDDGIIDPRDTREHIGELLRLCTEAEARMLRPNTFGVARF